MRHVRTVLSIAVLVVLAGAFVTLRDRGEIPSQELGQSNVPQDMSLTLTSPAFKDGERIPVRFTCDGENISPELHIQHVPEGTQSLILVMDDPDIPESVKQSRGIEKFDHWVLYNIPPDTTVIKEGELLGTTGLNSRGTNDYIGPCPPDREHRYVFRLYAVSGILNFIQTPTLDQVEEVARGMMLEMATLVGRYERTVTTE